MASNSDTSTLHSASDRARGSGGPETAKLSLDVTQGASSLAPDPRSDATVRSAHDGASTRTYETPHDRSNDLEATAGADRPHASSEARPRVPKFLGEYEILDEIARGGMGVVYRARQVNLGRLVALKVIRDSSLASYSDLRRFRAEAEAVAQLDHPNIVPIYEVGQVEDQPFFSMKLVEGGNLTKHVNELKANPRAAATLMIKVARAVHYAHQRAILHRDIKPSNILIDERGEPYITDFGLAKRFDVEGGTAETRSGAIMGTPAYMPPEQARGKTGTLTTAADVYSLGATLYEMLTGRAPFQADSVPDILRQVVEQEPQHPRALNTAIDRDLDTICLTCLDKNPEKRYASAESLADDLANWLADRTISARRASAKERVVKWVRRHKAQAALFATIAVSAVCLTFGGVWFTVQLRGALNSAEDRLYVADVNIARRDINEHLPMLAHEILEKHRPRSPGQPDRRGFEWYFLRRRAEPLMLAHHTDIVRTIAFHPNGKWLVSGGEDRLLLVWDLSTGGLLHNFGKSPRAIQAVAYSPDGQWLASAERTKFVNIRNAVQGEVIRTIGPLDGVVWNLCFSHDSRRLAVDIGQGDTCILDMASGSPLNKRSGASIMTHLSEKGGIQHTGLAYSQDGQWMATTQANTLLLCDARQGDTVKTLLGGKERVTSVAFSPDSRLIASGSEDGTCRIWEITTGSMKHLLERHLDVVTDVKFSPDGTMLASASKDKTARVHDVLSGRELRVFPHASAITVAAFDPSGSHLATAGYDPVIRVWDLSDVESKVYEDQRGAVLGMAIRPDGGQLATFGHARGLALWPIASDTIQNSPTWLPLSFEPAALAYDPHNRYLAAAGIDGIVVIHDLKLQREAQHLNLPGATLLGLQFSPDGNTLAAVGTEGAARIWNWHEARVVADLLGHHGTVFAVAFSPNGQSLATGGGDNTIRLWNPSTGRLERKLEISGQTKFIRGLAFSPDSRRLACAASDSTLEMWDLKSWTADSVHLQGHSGAVLSVAFSPDGRRIVSSSADHTVKLWDPATGLESLTLGEHTDQVTGVGFARSGRSLISVSRDGTLRVWDSRD